MLVHGVGLAVMVFSVTAIVVALPKMFDSFPGLVIDDRSLTDNASVFGAGFIPWSDIAGIKVQEIKSQRVLYVLLKDPSSYIDTLNPVKRVLLKAVQYVAPSPVGISVSSLSIKFDDLVALVSARLGAYRQNV
jgi:hypothetical protein